MKEAVARSPSVLTIRHLSKAFGGAQALTDVQLVHGSARLIAVYLDEYYVSASKTAAVKAALHRFIDGLDAADPAHHPGPTHP